MLAGLTIRGGALRAGRQLSDTFTNWIDHPAIAYTTRPATDPVAQLARRVADGQARLSSEGPSEYLRSLLDALSIPLDSQIAVFAKDMDLTLNNPVWKMLKTPWLNKDENAEKKAA